MKAAVSQLKKPAGVSAKGGDSNKRLSGYGEEAISCQQYLMQRQRRNENREESSESVIRKHLQYRSWQKPKRK